MYPRFIAAFDAVTPEKAKHNAYIAFDNGADGIAVVSHRQHSTEFFLDEVCKPVRREFRDKFIILNLWELDPVEVLPRIRDYNGLWVNSIMQADNPTQVAPEIGYLLAERRKLMLDIQLLGGVAYKIPEPQITNLADIAIAVRNAKDMVDVLVTSGEGVGVPPDIVKLRVVRDAALGRPVANAGGMTPEGPGDVSRFTSLVDIIIARNGLYTMGEERYVFDPLKVRTVARKCQMTTV